MEALHNARTGSKGLLDPERLRNFEPRSKQGQGHSSFIMHRSISTCLFPKQREAGGAHWLLGRSSVPTFTGRGGSPCLSPAENVGRPRNCCSVVYSAACHLNLSNRILIRSQALHTLQSNMQIRLTLSMTHYGLEGCLWPQHGGLCTMHMHTP